MRGKSKSESNDNDNDEGKAGRAVAASPQNGGLGSQAIHPLLEPEVRSRMGKHDGASTYFHFKSAVRCVAVR